MSKYSTGELAKLCGVTVRTVQYYDTRGILIPSDLSEGGRRLYSDEDLKRLKLICFLRNLELPIDAISQILKEEHPEKLISLLIEQQENALSEEISEKQESRGIVPDRSRHTLCDRHRNGAHKPIFRAVKNAAAPD